MKRVLLVLALVLAFAVPLFAEDYYIENYDINVIVGKDAVHQVEENLRFNYLGPHHGFYRYIPVKYTGGQVKRNIRIYNLDVSDEYDKETEDGFLVLKIGSADVEYTGRKDYTITYLYDIGEDVNEGYDEFYFNLVGDGWEIPIETATFTVEVPCRASDAMVWVTTGYRGSDTQVPYSIEDRGSSIVITGTVNDLRAKQAVTIRVQLPDGWYEDARQAWDYRLLLSIATYVAGFVLLALAIFCWVAYGRDKIPVITARFEPPEGLTPLTVGYVADGNVDDKDITSMIYYWADKGYLTITEAQKNKFVFTKLKDIPSSAPNYEKRLFNGFFKRGGVITVRDLVKSNFAETVGYVKQDVEEYFDEDRYLDDPRAQLLSFVFGVLCFLPLIFFCGACVLQEFEYFTGVFLLAPSIAFCVFNRMVFRDLIKKRYIRKSNFVPTVFSAVPTVLFFLLMRGLCSFLEIDASVTMLASATLCSSAIAFFATIMRKRSEYGNKILEQILGYREFIEKVSVDELKMMIDKNPDLYYHVLSYAIVLGLEDTWAKKFKNLIVASPSWYIGDSMMDAYFLAHMSARMTNSFRTSMIGTTGGGSHSIGGSSFGSSGFSGGGFGGGGGHAW